MAKPNRDQRQWMDIQSLDGLYQASHDGEIRSKDRMIRSCPRGFEGRRFSKGRVLRQFGNGNGYLYVTISIGGKRRNRYVHRLVCEAFHGLPVGLEVNHINADKNDNSSKNLEPVTDAENKAHAMRNGLVPSGSSHLKTIGAVQAERDGFGYVMFGKKQFGLQGFCCSCVYDCVNGKAERHKGFKFSRFNVKE